MKGSWAGSADAAWRIWARFVSFGFLGAHRLEFETVRAQIDVWHFPPRCVDASGRLGSVGPRTFKSSLHNERFELQSRGAYWRPLLPIRASPYRPMASRWSKPDLVLTPTGHAARLVADAILSDDQTLRYGCDPLSTGMIAAWRTVAGDEEWLRPMLRGFVG